MSINFSANQYEQTFNPRRMLNWELPKRKGKYPSRREGFSTIHANDRGHLLPNVPRGRASPWGNFVGTWDTPCHLPGNSQRNPTSRSEEAHLKLQAKAMDADDIMSGGRKQIRMFSPLPQRITEELYREDYNNDANPAMKPPAARTEELLSLRRHLTPPKLPMGHGVIHTYQPTEVDQLIIEPDDVVPRPLPNDGNDIPPEEFHVSSPAPEEPCTATGAVESLQENYIEEP